MEGAGENEQEVEREVEEYLETANWQLGNRRVRCCLMSNTGREEEREVETHLHRMERLHYFPSSTDLLLFVSRVSPASASDSCPKTTSR